MQVSVLPSHSLHTHPENGRWLSSFAPVWLLADLTVRRTLGKNKRKPCGHFCVCLLYRGKEAVAEGNAVYSFLLWEREELSPSKVSTAVIWCNISSCSSRKNSCSRAECKCWTFTDVLDGSKSHI